MLRASTIKFLSDLKKNNNKSWFDENRPAYDAAKEDFADLIQEVLDSVEKKDPSIKGLVPKDCMFRINRDIRFSKDKTPYKTNMGASIIRGGKKSIFAGYYFHCSPGESFVGGGLWMPTPQDLKKVRQEIDYCFDEFKNLVGSKKFKTVYGDLSREDDAVLTKVPQGFEKDNPAAFYLKLKYLIAMKPLKTADLRSDKLVKQICDAFEALQPLLNFMNRAIEN